MDFINYSFLFVFVLGIFIVFTNAEDSTILVEEDTVVISSSFTFSCFVGSMENFSHFYFSHLHNDLDTYTLRNETSRSIHLQFSQFGTNDNGYYTCGGYPGTDQNITVRLISFRSGKFYINIVTGILESGYCVYSHFY